MTWPYLHLISNHFPIILAVTGAAALVAGRLLRREGVMRWGAVGLLLAGLAAPIAYVTGLQAEETVEKLWYAGEAAIEAHEELGLWGLLTGLVAGAAAGIWLRRGGRRFGDAVTLLGVAAAIALVGTALQGGRIVHGSEVLGEPPPAGWPEGAGETEEEG